MIKITTAKEWRAGRAQRAQDARAQRSRRVRAHVRRLTRLVQEAEMHTLDEPTTTHIIKGDK